MERASVRAELQLYWMGKKEEIKNGRKCLHWMQNKNKNSMIPDSSLSPVSSLSLRPMLNCAAEPYLSLFKGRDTAAGNISMS